MQPLDTWSLKLPTCVYVLYPNIETFQLCNAATKIQASFRGHLTRKQEAEKKNESESSSSQDKKNEVAAEPVRSLRKTEPLLGPDYTIFKCRSGYLVQVSGACPLDPSRPTKASHRRDYQFLYEKGWLLLLFAMAPWERLKFILVTHLLYSPEKTQKTRDITNSRAGEGGANNTEELDIDLEDPELNKAAVKIQASFRGHMTRKENETHSN
ncbi:hypothetical protein NQ317_007582 [Molorchus minor]|uniref:Uncharacterized protein n=1 Tax=Molorchus minor TaxID=1323400 RepID=A0ABQ9JER7_9CUCU|nr:hypothetical protein NQ317_007582 [Molorchus minor]